MPNEPTPQRAILIVAHGSRREAAADELREMASALEALLDGPIVRAAFLELNEPDIPAGIRACVALGATRVDVLRYFLSSGLHAVVDVPDIVRQVGAELPESELRVLPIVGKHPGMLGLLKDIVSHSASD